MKGLCVYVDGGKGHYVPAKAVAVELEKLGVETAVEEFFDYLDIRWLGRLNKKYWRLMLKMPGIEQRLSKHNDSDSNGMEIAIKFANKHCWRMLMANLEEFRPDFIFATHPYASTILAEMLDHLKIDIPVYYYATDVFNAPVASICNKLKRFFISTEEGKERVLAMGQNPDTVEIVPFPLQQSIADTPSKTKAEARKQLGLDENLFTLQLNLGGEGIGSLSLLHGLMKKNMPMQIVIVGGMDKKMMKKLNTLIEHNKADNVRIYNRGFITDVKTYLEASDIIAGRAGINTILEAMYMHRPFLITELVYTVIPSAEYVEKYQVGWNCSDDKEKSISIVSEYVDNSERLANIDEQFCRIPIKFSAANVAEKMLVKETV